MRSARCEPIGDEVTSRARPLRPGSGLGDIVAAWPEAVGAAIAANAWPARLARDGTLHVATSSSAWAFELTQLAASIRRGCRSAWASLRRPRCASLLARFRRPDAEPVEASERTVPKVSEADRAEGARIAASIENAGPPRGSRAGCRGQFGGRIPTTASI